MLNKNSSYGFISPAGINSSAASKLIVGRNDVYNRERAVIKAEFANVGSDWSDPGLNGKLKEFAKQVIKVTTEGVRDATDLITVVLPAETIAPGDTYVQRDIHGVGIYQGTYGAAVRMSRPQFTQYTQTTNLKQVGLKLDLIQIKTGKYSPSELADYTSGLITAWRNRLLFVTTLAGATEYQSSGDQHIAGTSLAFGTMTAAFQKLTDVSDPALMIGRRYAIHKLSTMSGWSDTVIDEFKNTGAVGMYAGIPVVKVNSFTDPDYGWISPMDDDDLWIFSSLPAGRVVISETLEASDEIILSDRTMNIYYNWADGIGIFHTDRIVRVQNVT